LRQKYHNTVLEITV